MDENCGYLVPLLEKIKACRMQGGCSARQAQPVAHCTDRFAAHRLLLQATYARIFQDASVTVASDTPKGAARACHPAEAPALTTITGDPLHNLLNLQKKVSYFCPDARNLLADHGHAMARPSAESLPLDLVLEPHEVQELPDACHELLLSMGVRSENLIANCVGNLGAPTFLHTGAGFLLRFSTKKTLDVWCCLI